MSEEEGLTVIKNSSHDIGTKVEGEEALGKKSWNIFLPDPAWHGQASTYKSPLTCPKEHFSPQFAIGWHDRNLVSRSIKQQPDPQSLLYEQMSPRGRFSYKITKF